MERRYYHNRQTGPAMLCPLCAGRGTEELNWPNTQLSALGDSGHCRPPPRHRSRRPAPATILILRTTTIGCIALYIYWEYWDHFMSPWLYRVSHNWVFTLFCLFSRLLVLIQRFILPFFNSPGDNDSKTHLTFLPMSKIDQVTEQNVRQTGFRYYYFGTYKVYLNCI